jgi:hypothetical protein
MGLAAGAAPLGGIGGGGGPAPGGGGGGGGGAPIDGIGGGGGGPTPGMAGGGGGGAGGGVAADENVSLGVEPREGLVGLKASLLSAAERGLGGAIVPNNMEASCRALPAPGPSSSSEESSLSEPTTDHSSSSGRTRDGLTPVG